MDLLLWSLLYGLRKTGGLRRNLLLKTKAMGTYSKDGKQVDLLLLIYIFYICAYTFTFPLSI